MSSAHSTSRYSTALVAGLILGVLVTAMGFLYLMEKARPASARANELLYLPKGEYLRFAVLGYRQLAADLIWLKAIQHFDERQRTDTGYVWAYHAVDVVTDLDPKFVAAYREAGTIFTVWAGHVQESLEILTKGIRNNPHDWTLHFLVGYDYYFELCDPIGAAPYFRKAAELPGRPDYLPNLAARMTVESAGPQAAIEFLVRFYEQTSDERLRASLSERIKLLTVEKDLMRLEEAIGQFRKDYREFPRSLQSLIHKGVISGIPEEPFGGRYLYDPQNGSIVSTTLQERIRVYRHVQCRMRNQT